MSRLYHNSTLQLNIFNEVLSAEERKKCFLHSLKGNRLAYKRYVKSPLRYPGGKSLGVGLIVAHIPYDIPRLISPFFGGGSVEIALANELKIPVIGFDIFDILVNFWQVLIKQKAELYEQLLRLEPTLEVYKMIKAELKTHWTKEAVLPPLTLARDYYFNFNLSYGPGFLGWMSKIYADKNRYIKTLDKIKFFDGKNINVSCESFEIAFAHYPTDFFYLDPPYFLAGDSKMFRGIYPQRNFPVHHNGFRHDLLAELVKNHKGGFVLSYNDCEWVRETYKNYTILEPTWQYTMGQGEKRIGKNRLERGTPTNVKESHELLIIGNK